MKSVYPNKLISLMPGEERRILNRERTLNSESSPPPPRGYQPLQVPLWAQGLRPLCSSCPPGLWTRDPARCLSDPSGGPAPLLDREGNSVGICSGEGAGTKADPIAEARCHASRWLGAHQHGFGDSNDAARGQPHHRVRQASRKTFGRGSQCLGSWPALLPSCSAT